MTSAANFFLWKWISGKLNKGDKAGGVLVAFYSSCGGVSAERVRPLRFLKVIDQCEENTALHFPSQEHVLNRLSAELQFQPLNLSTQIKLGLF